MKKYIDMSKEELEKEYEIVKKEFDIHKKEALTLDMSRGKPCKEQLNLSKGMMSTLKEDDDFLCKDGMDCRNYGILTGIEEAKELLATYMENDVKNIIIYGNSSLNVMYNMVMQAYNFGILGSTPWSKLDKVKFLCPVPGYDRHFAICEEFGIEMINIQLNKDGPDMDKVEELVSSDESIKGIWCVPKYSNPEGISYSDEIVRRFARLKPKAKDFRIFWDNAYTVHHLYDDNQDYILEILTECEKVGSDDMVYKFGSTSKITFPGSGIASMACSENNKNDILKHMKVQTIGYDKVNQLRHVRYFKDLDGIKEHMRKHAAIMRPKFEIVEKIFDEEIVQNGIGHFTKPNGGYFISLYTMEGLAKKVVKTCLDIGLKLTEAGASFPYHKDPNDSNIRIAPSFPSVEEITKASRIVACVVKLCSLEKLLSI